MKNLLGLLGLLALFAFWSCSNGEAGSTQEAPVSGSSQVTIANWNLQTFFDGNKDGCEYKEFQKASDWNQESYKVRLERLCEFITTTDADIYIFEEIEKEGIIYDISNQLSGSGHNWNQKKFWNYSVFAKEESSAIGLGVLSRYPLSNVKTHSIDIRIHKTTQPSVRYILEMQVSIEGKPLYLLANHWKSKSGGEEESEIWRDWQESILAKRVAELLQEEDAALLICGDFNRDAADFVCNLSNQKNWQKNLDNTILRYADFGFTDYTAVNSLWFTDSGEFSCPKGSYYYDDQWERIDNLMIGGKVHKVSFTPSAISPWASAQGYPIPYKIYSGQGWSDHLPLCAKIVIGE